VLPCTDFPDSGSIGPEIDWNIACDFEECHILVTGQSGRVDAV
jgi:hypothetical protein